MKALEDRDPMPFGKHKGKPMEDVPATYLHFLWNDGWSARTDEPLGAYILHAMSALEREAPDKIWKKPAK